MEGFDEGLEERKTDVVCPHRAAQHFAARVVILLAPTAAGKGEVVQALPEGYWTAGLYYWHEDRRVVPTTFDKWVFVDCEDTFMKPVKFHPAAPHRLYRILSKAASKPLHTMCDRPEVQMYLNILEKHRAILATTDMDALKDLLGVIAKLEKSFPIHVSTIRMRLHDDVDEREEQHKSTLKQLMTLLSARLVPK